MPAVISLNVVSPGTVNQLPTVQVPSPADGSRVLANTPITLSAVAADADGTVYKVSFMANGYEL